MKTILVLAGGSESDSPVFDAALAAARPLAAHLEFLHVRIGPSEAAQFTPHLEFAAGSGLRHALLRLQAEADSRSETAAANFRILCEREAIEVVDNPRASTGVSASWREECGETVERIMLRARHNDLVVVGRSTKANGLPPGLIELLLVGCGRPVLVAPPRARRGPTGTVVVCWKETPAAARALGAALPLLSKSTRVVVLGVQEAAEGAPEGIRDIARQLAWHGIVAEARWISGDAGPAAEQLALAADEVDADLLVMGGYGHGRTRELIFGGCTQRFLDHANRAVLLMH